MNYNSVQSIIQLYSTYLNNNTTITLWCSYIILNLSYFLYLNYANCDCIHKLYKNLTLILGILSIILLLYVYNYKLDETIIKYIIILLFIFDILFLYFIRQQIIYLEQTKCYCSYTNNKFFDIRIIIKYINLINIAITMLVLLLLFTNNINILIK